jgi:chromosome segregation ATPase/predicted flap endonuclease-1-like 5' DNA nuclease
MLWFATELLGLLFGALVVGLLVGWLIWARSLRTARKIHEGDVGVLRTQVGSLGEESRRLQQRFAGVVGELDHVRSEKEQQSNEVSRTREAFMASQTHLAAAESEMVEHQKSLGELKTKIGETEARLSDADRELALSQSQAEARARNITTLESTLAGLTTELKTAQHELENIRARYEANRTDIEGARRQLATTVGLSSDEHVGDTAASPLLQAELANQHLRRALDAAAARANDAEAKSGDVRLQLAALRLSHDTDVNALRASLLEVNMRASNDRSRADAAEARSIAGEGVVRSESVETVSTLRRLWSATQAEMIDTKTRLIAAQRRSVDLERIAEASRAVYARKLVEVSEASEHRQAQSNRILQEEQSAAERRFLEQIADLERQHSSHDADREETHRLAVDQWRRDLHRRFDEIEEHKEQVVARDGELEQAKQRLLELADHHELEKQRVLAEREAELVKIHDSQRQAALDALVSDHSAATQTRDAETASKHAAQLASLQQQHDVLQEQFERDTAARVVELTGLQDRLQDGQAELERVAYERHLLEEERDRLAAVAADLEADRESVRDELHLAAQTHRGQLDGLRSNVEALEQQLEDRQNALDQHSEQIGLLVAHRDEIARTHASLAAEHEQVSGAHVAAVTELERVRNDHAGSSALVSTLQAELAQIAADRSGEQARLNELEHELVHRTDVIDTASAELASARLELLGTHEELVSLRQQVFAQHETANELADRIAELTGERNSLIAERDQLTVQHREVSARVADLSAEKTALAASLDDVRHQLDGANSSVAAMTEQLDLLRREAEATLNATTQSYNDQLAREADRLIAANEERERAARLAEMAQAETLHVRSAHEADLNAIATERETHDAERLARREIESRHTELNEDHSSLTAQHQALSHDHVTLVEQHHSLAEQHQHLIDRHTQLVAERDAIESHHDALLADHGDLQNEHANLASDRDELHRNIDLLSANHEQLRSRLETLTEEHSALSAQRDAVLTERNEIESQRRNVNVELSSVRLQLEEVSRRLSDAEASFEKSEQERAEIDQRLGQLDADLQAEIRTLRDQNEMARRHAELVEAEASRDRAVAASHLAELDQDRRRFRIEADGWGRELQQLRRLHEVAVARSQRRAIPEPSGAHASAETAARLPSAPRRLRTLKADSVSTTPETPSRNSTGSSNQSTNGSRAAGREVVSSSTPLHSMGSLVPFSARQNGPTVADELQRIEGIGPKIEAALKAAGVSTFVRLQAATSEQLRDALASAGLSFAPSLSTWSQQASYLVVGDEDGFRSYTEVLVAGRADERDDHHADRRASIT